MTGPGWYRELAEDVLRSLVQRWDAEDAKDSPELARKMGELEAAEIYRERFGDFPPDPPELQGMTPAAWVQWQAEKYDLEDVPGHGPRATEETGPRATDEAPEIEVWLPVCVTLRNGAPLRSAVDYENCPWSFAAADKENVFDPSQEDESWRAPTDDECDAATRFVEKGEKA